MRSARMWMPAGLRRVLAMGTLGVLGWAAFALTAQATTLMLFGTADLADRSNTVVTGTVTDIEARMHPEHQFIYTYVTVQVDEVLKGSASLEGSTVVLEELGGQVDRWIHQVPAVPQYEVGERVLSFLEDRDAGLFKTYGWVQGKFRFETDARGREILTRPDEVARAVLEPGTASNLTAMRADGSFEAAPLLDAIRNIANR